MRNKMVTLGAAAALLAGAGIWIGHTSASTLYWNGGVSGTWSNGGAGWTSTNSSSGTTSNWINGNSAEFSYRGGNVTVSGAVAPNLIYNDSNAQVTMSGGTIALGTASEAGSTITLESDQGNSNTTISSNIDLVGNQSWRSGSNGELKISGGVSGGGYSLNMENDSPYSGKTIELSGTVANLGSLTMNTTNTMTLIISGSVDVGSGTVSSASSKGTYIFDNAAALDSASTLSLVTGPVANLNYTGNMYLSSLILGGTTYNSGTFNKTNEATYFTGTGNIVVGAVPAPASLGLMAVGGLGMLLLKRRRTA